MEATFDPTQPQPTEPDTESGTQEPGFYCPGCGERYEYRQRCTGKAESPHPPIEVVSTDELANEPDPIDKEAHQKWAESLTAAPSAE